MLLFVNYTNVSTSLMRDSRCGPYNSLYGMEMTCGVLSQLMSDILSDVLHLVIMLDSLDNKRCYLREGDDPFLVFPLSAKYVVAMFHSEFTTISDLTEFVLFC